MACLKINLKYVNKSTRIMRTVEFRCGILQKQLCSRDCQQYSYRIIQEKCRQYIIGDWIAPCRPRLGVFKPLPRHLSDSREEAYLWAWSHSNWCVNRV